MPVGTGFRASGDLDTIQTADTFHCLKTPLALSRIKVAAAVARGRLRSRQRWVANLAKAAR